MIQTETDPYSPSQAQRVPMALKKSEIRGAAVVMARYSDRLGRSLESSGNVVLGDVSVPNVLSTAGATVYLLGLNLIFITA
jgi:hypothetical protein